MTNTATTGTTEDFDFVAALADLGFMPADDPDTAEIFPAWATDPRFGFYAVAHTNSGRVIAVDHPHATSAEARVFSPSMVMEDKVAVSSRNAAAILTAALAEMMAL